MRVFIYFLSALIIGILVGVLTSCTYSITMVHTEGQASDVVDETQTNTPDVKADVSIPAAAL